MGSLSRSKTVIGIAFIVRVWGSVWPIYKVALDYTPPILFSAFRSLLGGVLFTLFLLPQWRKIHLKETWPIYTISAIFNVILFFILQTIGLQYLPSGLFAVLVFLQPVLVVLLAWIWLKESLTFMKDVTSIEWSLPFIISILYGAIFGVTLAFVVYYKLMSAGEAGKVSSFTFCPTHFRLDQNGLFKRTIHLIPFCRHGHDSAQHLFNQPKKRSIIIAYS